MAENKIVNGVVLRTVNYRDFDRMLTLFTREEGRLSACARGAHRQKSPLSAASTLFCTGEYVLDEKNGRFFVKSCMLDAAYYPLRENPARLAYASALVQVCEEIVQPGQPMPELYDMLLRALAYLAYDAQTPCENIVLPFLMRAMVLSGHGVMLTRCAVCGGRIRDARFDPRAGGVICAAHAFVPLPVITAGDMATALASAPSSAASRGSSSSASLKRSPLPKSFQYSRIDRRNPCVFIYHCFT